MVMIWGQVIAYTSTLTLKSVPRDIQKKHSSKSYDDVQYLLAQGRIQEFFLGGGGGGGGGGVGNG